MLDLSYDFVLIGDNMIPNALNYSILGVEYNLLEDNETDDFILKADSNLCENNYHSTLGCDGINNNLGISLNSPNLGVFDYGIELVGDGSENNQPEFFLLDVCGLHWTF